MSTRMRAGLLAWLALAAAGCGTPAPRVVPAPVAVLPEYHAHSLAALGFPGMRRAFQCGDGAQLGAGDAAFAWSLESAAPASVSPVWFEADGVPVAHGWIVAGADSAAWEAAAFRVNGATDTVLVASVRVAVRRRDGGAPSPVPLRLHVRDTLAGPRFRPWDATTSDAARWTWESGRVSRDGLVLGGLVHVEDWRVSGGDGAARLRAAGSSASGVVQFWLADRPLGAAEARRVERHLAHESHAAHARAAWRELLAKGATFATPDTLANQAWRAALVTLLQGHERAGVDWLPMGNPFQYRDTWLRDGARVVRALALAGHSELACAGALGLSRYALPNGALVSQAGQLDGTGEALWAFEQAAGLPPDAEVSKRLLPVARRGGEWLRAQRAGTAEVARSLRVDWPGLLPYGDPRDAELVRGPLVGNDAWAIAGEDALARLAARAGDAEAAAAARAAAASHREAFATALARTPHPDVPPAWDGGGRDWGNCYVGFPARALPAGDPRLARLAERLWSRTGLHMVAYGPADSLHTYLGTDLAVWALLADRPADARAALADLLAHSSSTLGQAEIFSRSGRGFGANLPPHGTAAAQLVELLRDLVVMDERDTLEVAAGADLAWWAGTHLRRAPTRFGLLDLSLTRPAPERLEARWSAPGAPLRVRVPDGVTLLRAEGGTAAPGARWVECPPGARALVLHVRPS